MIKSTNTDDATHNLQNKSLIIFDWDGTLMDSIGLIVESMQIAGRTHGFEASETAVKDIIGLSLKRGIRQVFDDATPEQHLAIEQSYADHYVTQTMQPNNPHAKFFAGIEPMIQRLQASGKMLAVATGKKRVGLDRVIEVSNSGHYFAISRCTDESGSKPDPQMLIDILTETATDVEDAVFIGDSVHDIAMANALSMTSIAVNYGAGRAQDLANLSPTYQVESPQQLIQLLSPTS